MNELMYQIAKDLNINRYSDESVEAYGCRILYASIVAWTKVQLLGESYTEKMSEIDKEDTICVSRQYVISHVKKVVRGLLEAISHLQNWITVKEEDKPESELSKYIVEQLIFCGQINKLISPQMITSSPERIVYFKNNELLLGGVNWNSTVCNTKSIGMGNWRRSNEKIEDNYKDIFNIPKESIIQYYKALQKNAQWQMDELLGEYEYFRVDKQQIHYYAWEKYEESKVTDEITLLRNLNNRKQYMLVKYEEGQCFTARLDEWYVREKEIKRIMYYLQYQAGMPCIFNAKKKKDVVELYCHSELPNPEWRIMLLSSWPKRYYNDKYYRLVPVEIWGDIEEMLNDLGIKIKTEGN